MHRRQFLCSSLAGAAASATARAVPFVAPDKPPKHFILLWMAGGPSHLDLWDIKEGSANQGSFNAIDTAVPGIRIGELLPTVAKEFNNLSVIRTLCSREADKTRGTYRMTHVHAPSGLGFRHPGVGAVAGCFCGSRAVPLPRCIAVHGDPGFGDPGDLGPRFAGFPVQNAGTAPGDLRRDDDGNAARAADRRQFLDMLDANFAQDVVPHVKTEEDRRKLGHIAQNLRDLHEVAWEYARRIDPKTFEFDAREVAKLDDRFGNNGFGRGCLLASKLANAGAPAISVTLGGWDLHGNFANALPPLATTLDRGFGGLMAELRETGLIGETLVLCAGPFGRSPRLNQNGARIPWSNGWSVVLGGCGIGGVEYGKMDADGLAVQRNPVSVEQLYATIYAALGIDLKDPNVVLRDPLGRPYHLTGAKENARPIKELLGTAKG